MRRRRRHYRAFSGVLIAAVLLLVMMLNLIFSTWEERCGLRIDLTRHRMYSLSDTSKQLIQGLEQDVYIYTVYTTDSVDIAVENLLREYVQLSSHLIWENIDPVRNPTFTQRFDPQKQGIETGSVIVSDTADGSNRYRVLSSVDFVVVNYADQTVAGINVEQPISSAVQYVSSGITQNVRFLTGHGEAGLQEIPHVVDALQRQNCTAEDLDLRTGRPLDPASDILAVIGPTSDLPESDYSALQRFIENGGNIFCAFDPVFTDSMLRFNLLLENYHMRIQQNAVFEGDESKYYSTPALLLPDLVQHTITEPLIKNNLVPVMPACSSITVDQGAFTETAQSGGFLLTSSLSYAKNANFTTLERQAEDAVGPFQVGTVGMCKNQDRTSRIVVLGSSQGIVPQDFFSLQGNTNLFENCISWLSTAGGTLSIPFKPLYDNTLALPSRAAFRWISACLLVLFPAVCLAAGGIVWNRRKHR